MSSEYLFWLAPISAFITLVIFIIICLSLKYSSDKKDKLTEMYDLVFTNISTYIFSQMKVEVIFFILFFALFALMGIWLRVQSPFVCFAFITGGIFSSLAGYLSFKSAISTTFESISLVSSSVSQSFKQSFKAASMPAIFSLSLGLLDISFWYYILNTVLKYKDSASLKESIFIIRSESELTVTLLSFVIGTSLHALITSYFGGIFSKGSEIGAELVTKIEAGIPEKDIKNPATVAKSIGETATNIYSLSSGFYSLYTISIVAAMVLAVSAFNEPTAVKKGYQTASIILPMVLAAIGLIITVISNVFVKIREEANSKDLVNELKFSATIPAILMAIISAIVIKYLLPDNISLLGSTVTGIMTGIIINWSSEYYSSSEYDPSRDTASQSASGLSTLFLNGFEESLQSTCIPLVTTAIGLVLAYAFSDGFRNTDLGLYGISIAAVAMLTTLGPIVSASAYGSIMKNMTYIAEVTEVPQESQAKMEVLVSYGQTAVSIGKGVIAGATAYTGVSLLAAFTGVLKNSLLTYANFANTLESGNENNYIYTAIDKAIPINYAMADEFMAYFGVQAMNPLFIAGIFIGIMLAFVICACSLRSVKGIAYTLAEEVRRQFKEIAGLLQGEEGAKADYELCLMTTLGISQKELITLVLTTIFIPFIASLFTGVAGIVGIILGIATGGFALSIMILSVGGIWNGAKQYIESGQFGGKGSENHNSTVTTDLIGSIIKDSCGPVFNVLLIFVIMFTILTSGMYINFVPTIQKYLGLSHSDIAFKETYKSLVKANKAEYPSLERKKPILSDDNENFGFEDDPLMGTEDIILPKNDPTKNSLQEPYKPKYEPGMIKANFGNSNEKEAENSESNEPAKSESKTDNNSFDSSSGFGGGFDEGFDSSETTAKSENKSGSSSDFSGGFDGGFDSFDEPAKKEDKTDNKSLDTSSGFDGGFDSFDESAKEEAKTETKVEVKEEPKAETKEKKVTEKVTPDNSSKQETEEVKIETKVEVKEDTKTENKVEVKEEAKIETAISDNSSSAEPKEEPKAESKEETKKVEEVEKAQEAPKENTDPFSDGFDAL